MDYNTLKEDRNSITEAREDHMIPLNLDGKSTYRNAHFLKPVINHTIQSLPKSSLEILSSCTNTKDLTKVLNWTGKLSTQKSWNSWVDEFKQTHGSFWRKIGIFDAIVGSTCTIKKDKELMVCLVEKWCPQTNTFVFSWGECSVTLEDIMILGGFSVTGNPVLSTPCPDRKKAAEIKDELAKTFPILRKTCYNNISHIGWLEYFKGKGGELEHVAFIFLWLSRFVFRSTYYIVVKNNLLFDVAISLVMGTKFALAPAVLASIYRDLSRLKETGDSSDQFDIWAPLYLVQLWAWERFPGLSPKPVFLVHGEPRICRWNNVNKHMIQNLRLEVESASDSFIWRPYVMCLENWDIPKCYLNEGMWVMVSSELGEEFVSFMVCLRACELDGLGCVVQYSPHRVGMQFGMDQDIPQFIPRINGDDYYSFAGSRFVEPMEGVIAYFPARLFEGDVTVEYTRWWRPRLLSVDHVELFMSCPRGKRSSRKRKSLSQLLEAGVSGRCTSKALICSSHDGMISEKLLNVVNTIASGDALSNQQDEGIIGDRENGDMVYYATSTAALNEQVEDTVDRKGKGVMLDETASNTALNEEGGIVVAEHANGTHAQGDEVSPMAALDTPANLTELDIGTRSLSSALDVEHHSQVGNDAMRSTVMRHTLHGAIDVEEEMDSAHHIQESSVDIESRIERLEKLISMYKQAMSVRPADV